MVAATHQWSGSSSQSFSAWPLPVVHASRHVNGLLPGTHQCCAHCCPAEYKAWKIYRSLDVDYVFVVFGGMVGYSSDDVNKFLWMVRIGGGVYPELKESDYLGNGGCVVGVVVVGGDSGFGGQAVLLLVWGGSPGEPVTTRRGAACELQPQDLTPTHPCQRNDPTCVCCAPPPCLTVGQYRIDAGGSPTMLKSLMYKLSYYE